MHFSPSTRSFRIALLIGILFGILCLGGTSAQISRGKTEDAPAQSRYEQCLAGTNPEIAYRCEALVRTRLIVVSAENGVEQILIYCLEGQVKSSVDLYVFGGSYEDPAPEDLYCGSPSDLWEYFPYSTEFHFSDVRLGWVVAEDGLSAERCDAQGTLQIVEVGEESLTRRAEDGFTKCKRGLIL